MKGGAHNTVRKDYQYVESGLDNVWISGGFEIIKSPYGDSLRIKDVDGLHKCIANCLVNKPELLTGREFRFLRVELDLSQAMIADLFGRDERTIREWENGEEPVKEPANRLVRFIYKQRFTPDANFEELSKTIKRLQAFDRKVHEMKFEMKNAEKGWEAKLAHAA